MGQSTFISLMGTVEVVYILYRMQYLFNKLHEQETFEVISDKIFSWSLVVASNIVIDSFLFCDFSLSSCKTSCLKWCEINRLNNEIIQKTACLIWSSHLIYLQVSHLDAKKAKQRGSFGRHKPVRAVPGKPAQGGGGGGGGCGTHLKINFDGRLG